ncbi:DUF6471 domain-containing protein [Arcobacter sp. F2176]|uniref:DUF6471 domain-containing protein n=1 Tax=Arcobacter sp. F2176 TaxID=2044511 RepID=UPI00100C21E2|nr:DUF6471 domain-containing protein [Arcobacter sp. F2176]RXJ77355.1 hypothetical protein CRU95_16065 [Arcobacter sp. F2176]
MEEKDYTKEAKLFIKKLMLQEDINFIELTKILNEKGFDYTEASVRQKISRGRFDFAFGLQVIEVLRYKLNLEKDEYK